MQQQRQQSDREAVKATAAANNNSKNNYSKHSASEGLLVSRGGVALATLGCKHSAIVRQRVQ